MSLTVNGAEKLLTISAMFQRAMAAWRQDDPAGGGFRIFIPAGTITVKPFTASNAINFGSAVDTTPNTLELSDTELTTLNSVETLAADDRSHRRGAVR